MYGSGPQDGGESLGERVQIESAVEQVGSKRVDAEVNLGGASQEAYDLNASDEEHNRGKQTIPTHFLRCELR